MRLQRVQGQLFDKARRQLLAEAGCLMCFRSSRAAATDEWGGLLVLPGQRSPGPAGVGGVLRLVLDDGRAGDILITRTARGIHEEWMAEFRGGSDLG